MNVTDAKSIPQTPTVTPALEAALQPQNSTSRIPITIIDGPPTGVTPEKKIHSEKASVPNVNSSPEADCSSSASEASSSSDSSSSSSSDDTSSSNSSGMFKGLNNNDRI
jgi:hypothetical protein